MNELSEAEATIVAEGLQAQALLDNPLFAAVLKTLMFECFEAYTQSTPAQGETREQTYYQYRGLVAIEERIRALVQHKDEIERKLNAEEDLDD